MLFYKKNITILKPQSILFKDFGNYYYKSGCFYNESYNITCPNNSDVRKIIGCYEFKSNIFLNYVLTNYYITC